MITDLEPLTADEAIAQATASAFEVTDKESSDYGRKIVHCFAGMHGADWDLDKVISTLTSARSIGWIDHWNKHNLAVATDEGRLLFFDVPRPKTGGG